MIRIGLEGLIENPPAELRRARLGLLCNQASLDRGLRHARDLLMAALPGTLACLFSPQHGFFAEKQDNMIESGHMRDPVSGLPVFSLYGDRRRPSEEMFSHFDVLLVDLIDVGTRVYTFAATLAHCLKTAATTGRKVVVLDRPNPIGGLLVEGNLLRPDWASFVGLYPLPMRHGLSIGELALYMNREFGLGADLSVAPMAGWRREMLFGDTGFPWVFPSPNMPTPATAMVYPGQVIWEGTNVSEGRGTTLPFELFGAPFVDGRAVLDALDLDRLPGAVFRPLVFEPCSGKWAGRACGGLQIHVTDPVAFRPYRCSLAFLQAIMRLYPRQFAYKEPPYEYEFERLPMDLILGDQDLRLALERGEDLARLEAGWRDELAAFETRRAAVLLYD